MFEVSELKFVLVVFNFLSYLNFYTKDNGGVIFYLWVIGAIVIWKCQQLILIHRH